MPKRRIPTPAVVAGLLVVLAGILATPFATERDAAARAWMGEEVGGSVAYALGLGFARVLPFIVAVGVLVALWQRLKGPSPERVLDGQVLRHERTVVVTHWINTVGMALGLVSAAFLLRWLERSLSLSDIYLLHYAASALVVFVVAHHVTYHGVSGGRGLLPRSRAEVKQALAELLGYVGVFARQRAVLGVPLPTGVRRVIQRPLQRWGIIPRDEDKYLATEKVLSYPVWAVLVGLLVVTGFLKGMRYLWPIPGPLLQAASFLHDGATVWVLVWLVAHVAPVVLVPRNLPLLRSMVTGRISVEYVQQFLPLWHQRLQQGGILEASEPAAAQREPA
ncbi:MAG: cytochrome b/b6 domain-containing protein [Chloroflexi bacterium]|nr:cytochrome b/b6 domain-containing protein [Chloroflexota bacterium]